MSTNFGDITPAQRALWHEQWMKAHNEYGRFLRGYTPIAVPWHARLRLRVRAFLRSFVYIECDCGCEINRWTGRTR